MLARLKAWLTHRWTPWIVLAVVTVAVTAQQVVFMGHGDLPDNYLTYREAFFRLVRGEDLYAPYPQFNDLYKYSPAFALFLAPIAILPVPLGLLLWNALNAFIVWLGLRLILPPPRAALALAIMGPELLGAVQNSQSNALLAGLLLLAFAALERDRPAAGAAAVIGGAFVKVFPLAGGALGLLYPRKIRFGLACAAVGVFLALVPAVVGPSALLGHYRAWEESLAGDARFDHGMSVMGMLFDGFRIPWPSWPIQLLATITLLLPLALRRDRTSDRRFRLHFLCSLLVYLVIFNHEAESPSYVIAMAGIGTWFAAEERPARLHWTLLVLSLLLVSFGTSDLFPHSLQHAFIRRFDLKALPCFLVWLHLQRELLAPAPASAPSVTALSGAG